MADAESRAPMRPPGEDQTPRAPAPARQALVVFALAYGLLHHLGGALGGLGTVGPTRWADWAELLVPYAVLVPAAVALAAGGARRTVWAVYLVGALVYAEGKGVHVAANSIGNVAPGPASHLWDEVVGHYLWYAGAALVLGALAATFARSAPPHGIGGYLLALLVGLTHATNSLEGGTAVFGLVVAIVGCGWGWSTRAGLGRLLLVAYAPAVLVLVGYGLWHGGFPQPSELG
ncbi:hypothetical protein [Micromonospora sp. NPDC004704]